MHQEISLYLTDGTGKRKGASRWAAEKVSLLFRHCRVTASPTPHPM